MLQLNALAWKAFTLQTFKTMNKQPASLSVSANLKYHSDQAERLLLPLGKTQFSLHLNLIFMIQNSTENSLSIHLKFCL